jgi:hypothetical protein
MRATIWTSVLAHVLLFSGLEIAPRLRISELPEPGGTPDYMPVAPIYLPLHCSLRASMASSAEATATGSSRVIDIRVDGFSPNWILFCPAPAILETNVHSSGVVKVRLAIGADGHTRQIRVVSGHPLLIPATLDAIRRWRFGQTTIFDEDEVEVTISVAFGDLGSRGE